MLQHTPSTQISAVTAGLLLLLLLATPPYMIYDTAYNEPMAL
jgi:hypothetical protein